MATSTSWMYSTRKDLVTIPLPGMPSGAAGVPPPIRFESKSLQSLRAGGIPLWTIVLKTQYEGIRSGGAMDKAKSHMVIG